MIGHAIVLNGAVVPDGDVPIGPFPPNLVFGSFYLVGQIAQKRRAVGFVEADDINRLTVIDVEQLRTRFGVDTHNGLFHFGVAPCAGLQFLRIIETRKSTYNEAKTGAVA